MLLLQQNSQRHLRDGEEEESRCVAIQGQVLAMQRCE
jgi:hypothetical protein